MTLPPKPTFEEIYMKLAHDLAKRSHCIKMKVGAVIAKDTRVVATGHNGPPEGRANCDERWPMQGCPRSARGGCALALHAEQNAILFALKNNIDLQGATLYLTLSPCLPCARMIFAVGIQQVFYSHSYASFKKTTTEEGLDFLRGLDVKVIHYQLPSA